MSLAILALFTTLLACGESDPLDLPPAAPVAATSPTAPGPAAVASPRERLLGTWSIVLSDEERRQVELLQLAFRDPAPTEEELAASPWSEEERGMVRLMAAARAADPDDPKVAEMKAAAEGLRSATLTITADTMTFQAGAVTEVSTWSVQAEEAESLTIEAVEPVGSDGSPGERDLATIRFEGEDRLVMADVDDPSQRQVFARKR